MDPVLNTNADSNLLVSLWQNELSQPFKYKIIGNFCNTSRTYNRIYPTVGNTITSGIHGMEVVFPINKFMLLQDLVHHITPTVGNGVENAMNATSEWGLFFYQRQILRVRGKTICQTDPYHTQVRQKSAKFAESSTISKLAQPYTSGYAAIVPNNNAFQTFCPFYNTFSEKTCMNLDTKFLEPMELACTIETQANLGLVNALASVSLELWAFYKFLDNESYLALRATNFEPTRAATWLFTDSYLEAISPVSSGMTTATIQLKCKYVVTSTSFFSTFIGFSTAGPLKHTVSSGTAGIITSFDFIVSGQYIMSGIPTGILEYDTGRRFEKSAITCSNAGALTASLPGYGPHTLYFSEIADRSFNSGALAMYNAGQPLINLYFVDPGANSNLIVTHETLCLMVIDSSNGVIEVQRST
jgi:hypothetical protein